MIENIETVEPSQILATANRYHEQGCRFVTITSCAQNDGFDLIYSFDKDLHLFNFRVSVSKDEVVPSLSPVYLAAAFVENEIKELFGIRFEGLAVDYGGRFVISENTPQSPFGCGVILEKKGGGGK